MKMEVFDRLYFLSKLKTVILITTVRGPFLVVLATDNTNIELH